MKGIIWGGLAILGLVFVAAPYVKKKIESHTALGKEAKLSPY